MRRQQRSKLAFLVLAGIVLCVWPVLSFDFGITEDEQLHNQHGKSILAYFLEDDRRATRDPLDASDRLEFEYDEQMNDLSGALNVYGGLFDLLCAATHRWVSPLGEFENRHFVNSLFGVLLVVFTGLMAAQLAGWRAGVLGLLLIALSPRIVGHSMNNPVDLPFAALYMFSLYFLLRFIEQLPAPRKTSWIPLLVGIPLATDIRIAGLVLLFYLGAFVAVWSLPRMRWAKAGRALGITTLLGSAAYLLVSVVWPLAHRNPFTTPWMAFGHLSRLETFNAYDLFEGIWIDRWEIPWYFAPKWLLIGTPLFVVAGLLLMPFLAGPRLPVRPDQARIDRAKLSMVAFASLFPIVFVIVRGSNLYNDARHLLFAYPPLIVVCAVAVENALRLTTTRLLRVALALLVAGACLEPLHFMIRNYPHVGVYFSPLVGGVNGSWRRYETDFWGQSVRESVEWIQAHGTPRPGQPLRIRLWYGDQTKASYYVDKRPGFEHVVAPESSPDWDYKIMLTVECKHFPAALEQWPPHGTVYEVRADDIPLNAVVMNVRGREPDEIIDGMRAWARQQPTHANYMALSDVLRSYGRESEALEAFRRAAELPAHPVARPRDDYIRMSLEHYAARRYGDSLLAGRLAVEVDPESDVGYNNICSAHLALKQWREAQSACERSLRLRPDNEYAKNNLRLAKRALGAR